MMATTEVEVSIPALSDNEDHGAEALVHVGEDELATIEPENEGVVFVITTGTVLFWITKIHLLAETI